jgi:hypothetical protein
MWSVRRPQPLLAARQRNGEAAHRLEDPKDTQSGRPDHSKSHLLRVAFSLVGLSIRTSQRRKVITSGRTETENSFNYNRRISCTLHGRNAAKAPLVAAAAIKLNPKPASTSSCQRFGAGPMVPPLTKRALMSVWRRSSFPRATFLAQRTTRRTMES